MQMMKAGVLMVLVCSSVWGTDVYYTTPDEIDQQVDEKTIYYGSTVRLENFQSQYFHQVQYGSGSGQQSVTGMQHDNDYNSLWTLKECFGQQMKLYCNRVVHNIADEIKCGDCVRLEHMMTQKNLHTHEHTSPVSGNSEVSGYGQGGVGDDGNVDAQSRLADNWLLVCVDHRAGTPFKAAMWFFLQHKLRKTFLRANKRDYYNVRNCGHHCPIEGQLEISATYSQSDDNKWKVYAVPLFYVMPQGLFYLPDKSDQENTRHCNSYGSCDDLDDEDSEYQTIDYKRRLSDL